MDKVIANLAQKVLSGELLSRPDIDTLAQQSYIKMDDLLYWANEIRKQSFGNKIQVCSIVPGRLGGCDQDCAFCAQSARYNTHLDKKPKVLSDKEILAAARRAKEKGVGHFGIVYSGKTVSEKELARLEQLIEQITNEIGIAICGGFGILNKSQLKRLTKAGMRRYNHNLETSRNHFGKIVSTHTYNDRIDTIKASLDAGVGVCAGGLFGIGETESDRIDMALQIRELNVDMAPLNFLHPIPGTPMGDQKPLTPSEILRIIALYRFILPRTNLKVAGGRVLNLRDMQSWIFYAGCTSIITGDYLTTAGRAVEDDLCMLADLGLEAV
ncbi:MAG: biotin synthase BioB [Planctomycetes bacterium]|nr:biotin synthase BioB [Planctomycetota bacterium]